jgi:hypothetical protein
MISDGDSNENPKTQRSIREVKCNGADFQDWDRKGKLKAFLRTAKI